MYVGRRRPRGDSHDGEGPGPTAPRLRREATDRALKGQLQPDVKQLTCAAVDLGGVLDSFVVNDRARLEQRINARPSMHATIMDAATAIQALFKDGCPKLVFESSGHISIHIPTRFNAEQASVLYDRLLKEWWRGNVSVEDKMVLVLDFI